MSGDDTVTTDAHIMGNLHQIIDLGALTNYRVRKGATINSGVGTNLNIILNDDAPNMRHFFKAALAANEAKTILTNARTGLDKHPVAQERIDDGSVRTDNTIAANLAIGTDDRARSDDRSRANLDMIADDRAALDGDIAFKQRCR